jgi:hypothetical protein
MEQYLKDPMWASAFAAGATVVYIHSKAKLNNEPQPNNSDCFKPAALVAVLVYFIVVTGVNARETISLEPFET